MVVSLRVACIKVGSPLYVALDQKPDIDLEWKIADRVQIVVMIG